MRLEVNLTDKEVIKVAKIPTLSNLLPRAIISGIDRPRQ